VSARATGTPELSGQFLRLAIVLGLITAVGPFSTDMYLPALPSMGRMLHAPAGEVQMTVTIFFVMLGVCQLLYGPLSDRMGRRLPLQAGLGLYALATLGCALAPGVGQLIGLRALQAAGACSGMVIPRAVVRDLHTGHRATQLMALLMAVVSISPILAPLTGSFVMGAVGWRGVFGLLTGVALIALLLAMTQLPETRPLELRSAPSGWSTVFATYRRLLSDRTFMGLTAIGAFGMSAFFVYLGSAAFVLIDHYGLSPLQFSLLFALNAVAYMGIGQLSGPLTHRLGLIGAVRFAVAGFAVSLCSLAIAAALGATGLVTMVVLLFVGYGFLGIVQPTTMVLALEEHGAIAGTASALMGATRLMVGGATMASVGLLTRARPEPMLLGIAACALVSLLAALLTLRPERRARAAQSGPAVAQAAVQAAPTPGSYVSSDEG
jgi:MFS transporter, DHA1 family, multidrug resistance protein